MKTVQRHDTKIENLWVVAKFIYYFLTLPCLIFFAVASLIIYLGKQPGGHEDPAMAGFFILIWIALVVPLGFRRYGKVSRRRQLKKMTALLTSDARFSPQPQHQVLDAGQGKYFGLDTRTGNVLYIHIVKKGIVDVMGLTMRDWTERELECSTLRLNTRNPEVPVLSINAHPSVAKALFNTLGAMSHNSYSESFPSEPWPLHVGIQSRFVEYEHDVVVPQAI